MSEELKPCPFCGKPFEVLPSENMEDNWAYKHNSPDCPMDRNELTGWVWSAKDIMAQQFNTRPIENALLEALNVVLDQVDYTAGGNCRMNDMVGAVLDKRAIVLARAAIALAKGE